MSIAASWLILAVIVVRILLKKAPKAILCALWALVAIRLICPVSIDSVFSLVPNAQILRREVISGSSFDAGTGIHATGTPVSGYSEVRYLEGVTVPGSNAGDLTGMFGWIWIAGVAFMLLYAILSYLKLWKKVGEGVELRDNIWLCDRIDTPFILGIIRPRIFLPSAMDERQIYYVVEHEKAHLARRDHWWKPLGFVLLAIYWFHPLCWVAFWLLCQDIELACDEKVIKGLDAHSKKAYSEALFTCSVTRRTIAACPLAFGEIGVKERIKTVLKYKKPAFWIIVAAVAACIVVAACFLTNPKSSDTQKNIGENSTAEIETNDFVLTYNNQSYSLDSGPTALDDSIWQTDYTDNKLVWMATQNASVATARGIRVGSTKAEVMAAYGITGGAARGRTAVLWCDLGDSEPLSDRLTFYFDTEDMKEAPDTMKVTQIALERRALIWTDADVIDRIADLTLDDVAATKIEGNTETPLPFKKMAVTLEALKAVVKQIVTLDHFDTIETMPGGVRLYLYPDAQGNTDLHINLFAEKTEGRILLRYVGSDVDGGYNQHLEVADSALYAQILYIIKNAGQGGSVSNVNRKIGKSERYAEDEINKAMDAVTAYFDQNFEGCEMTDLWYDEEKGIAFPGDWTKQYGADEAIILLSNFNVDESGGDGGFEANTTYSDWHWILTRDTDGAWALKTWGY